MKSKKKGRYPAFRLSRKSRQPLFLLKISDGVFLTFHTRNASQNTAEFVLLDQLAEEDHLLRNI
ncbi:hypothetical protein CFI04_15955 [Bacillus amyloliquefaciens]|uniref:ISBma2, transposase n=1 Tax=Bacillus amyloliquefaciens (strain ATCC 23350 / DSM 7 / BCRC 11601 / CCUG 28519 / NBRC 15535 / NRRL B-14393 / F) TaxID=692420 RepID=A0A9P1JE43_BACAS|nr:hypothetical protein LL3_00235 [Bacillus amyloliquefaciens LL3]KYC96965.1 hypothetical protein B425_0237 [Bacillus amyloliquefaciens]OXL18847.1 hypothetical protein CFI04_15955 [Bacillus amyloliquefaciens]CBI41355.1 ISBma2, transposase fragment [Bacillus amyloliquefaciens DSM 7] [Bacillus amyloliquefaciens DSM 7 = ATCC 23350]